MARINRPKSTFNSENVRAGEMLPPNFYVFSNKDLNERCPLFRTLNEFNDAMMADEQWYGIKARSGFALTGALKLRKLNLDIRVPLTIIDSQESKRWLNPICVLPICC